MHNSEVFFLPALHSLFVITAEFATAAKAKSRRPTLRIYSGKLRYFKRSSLGNIQMLTSLLTISVTNEWRGRGEGLFSLESVGVCVWGLNNDQLN